MTMEYIPSGMSKEQWKKLKEKEANKNKGKNLGKVGITSFKSRTFDEWQKSGGKNLFPVDPTKVKSQKEIPYMQRAGGSADDSDIVKKKWRIQFFWRKEEGLTYTLLHESCQYQKGSHHFVWEAQLQCLVCARACKKGLAKQGPHHCEFTGVEKAAPSFLHTL